MGSSKPMHTTPGYYTRIQIEMNRHLVMKVVENKISIDTKFVREKLGVYSYDF